MSVTERLMKPGRFSLRLRPNTPASVLAAVGMFDHIVITPARLRGWEGMSDANILASAIYTGVVKARPDVNEFTGAGLADWLGTDDGLGDLLDSAVTNSAATLSTWVTSLRPASLAAGTVNNTGTSTHTYTYQWMTRREALTHACRAMGAEWRVDPDFTLDAATPGNLHANYTTPRAVITRKAEGAQGSLVGIEAVAAVRGLDVSNYTTKVIVAAREGDGATLATGSATGANVYVDGLNNNVVMERLINAPLEPAANANGYAQATLNLFGTARQTLALSSDTYAATLAVRPGDRVYVYDQRSGLTDSANQLSWRGEIITPVLLRCRGIIWPIMAGMGVYARRSGATPAYTDLSDWFQPEDDSTEWELSTTGLDVDDPGQLGASFLGSNPDVVSRTPSPSTTWTPAISAATPPTLGSGSSVSGLYKVVDGLCWFQANITFGSSGAAAGSGTYTITGLPIAPVAGRGTALSGRARLTDPGVGVAHVDALVDNSGNITMRYAAAWPAGADTRVGAAAPWTWTNDDRIELWGCYPVV